MTTHQQHDHDYQMNEDNEDKIQSLRARVHRMSDTVQGLVLQLAIANTNVTNLQKAIENFASKQELSASVDLMNVHLSSLRTSITSIETGVRWVVGLVLSAVILAVLGLVFVKEGKL